jgi:electron transport complex protein RnfC
VGLDPEYLYKNALQDKGGEENFSCHGCGCCDLVCPSRLPLSRSIVEAAKPGESHD